MTAVATVEGTKTQRMQITQYDKKRVENINQNQH
jgi:hypothetical protein